MRKEWWENPWLISLVIIACAIPLVLPATPPLVDVPGHIGRYRIQLDLARSTDLQKYFTFQWNLIGNLGVDLLIIPLTKIFSLEHAVKIITISIPVITCFGIYLVTKQVHNSVQPTTVFAVPFIFNYPFNYGFVNFSLSMGLALCLFAVWLWLGKTDRYVLRIAIFIPTSFILWLIHAYGWAFLGLLAYSSDLVAFRDQGKSWPAALILSVRRVVVLSGPVFLTFLWRSGEVSGGTVGYLHGLSKAFAATAVLRDRWLIWDSFGAAVGYLLIGAASFDRRLATSRTLVGPAIALAIAYLFLPSVIFGSAFADMRILPFAVMIAILSIRQPEHAMPHAARNLAALGMAFLLLRLGGNSLSYYIADQEVRLRLQALDHVPKGARVLTLVGEPCGNEWKLPRHAHLGSFVIARKFGFSNDQWQTAGAQLMKVKYPPAGRYSNDLSKNVYSRDCLKKIALNGPRFRVTGKTADEALADFPRSGFDFVWLIEPLDFRIEAKQGLSMVWRSPDAVLYKVAASADRTAAVRNAP